MAPLSSSARLPAALVDLLASREPNPQPQDASSSSLPVAAITRRLLHSLPPRIPLSSLATRTPTDTPSRTALSLLEARQAGATTATIPGAYPGVNAGPDPGTVVGITLGSVAAFLLLLWLVYTCLSMGNRSGGGGFITTTGTAGITDTVSSYGTASVVTRKSRRRHSHHRHSHHRSPSRRQETVEIRTSRVMPDQPPMGAPPPPPQMQPMQPPPGPPMMGGGGGGGERIVMEETIRRSNTPMRPPPPRMVHRDDDDDEDEDEVVVIEEHTDHTPPRRHKSRSHRRRSSSVRRESGFREVEPDRFAGGDAPLRDVRRSSRHGR
ncbi:hypothetical protein VMCG_05280 [Cytospora schulzeri]|uniref:Uncharacterized protein n=1 Tax=Cytospora schulzeri TaxID=448051 RepID=A0A423WQS9_9PEZI|nr:hypothetical protein VMCG_05280 [Valsa malicola]